MNQWNKNEIDPLRCERNEGKTSKSMEISGQHIKNNEMPKSKVKTNERKQDARGAICGPMKTRSNPMKPKPSLSKYE